MRNDDLPPLDALRAFDAAARHLSFTRAAEELFVTQSAVSKQVIALESALATRLFERKTRALALTTAGERLQRAASDGIGVLLVSTDLGEIAALAHRILDIYRGKIIGEGLEQAVREIQRDFQNDPVKQRHFIRRYLKRNKVRPWAKAVVLGVQGLVLVLLYQVFIGGINTQEKIPLLYSWMPRPDFINTQFFWFDVGQRNYFLAAIVAGAAAPCVLTSRADGEESKFLSIALGCRLVRQKG